VQHNDAPPVTVEIYEPPVGCGVGTCGPDAEDELERFNAELESLEGRGVAVSRFNLGLEPEAFTSNPTVKAAIKEHGIACLPFVFLNGKLVSERRYSFPRELAQQLAGTSPGP
jgi:Arsenical resistance operon protein ArsD